MCKRYKSRSYGHRILQGIGLSAPRTMSIAIIRDMYSGDYMARIMSFVTVVLY
jgi:DHA1 family bicyclomycin/chloramphenicol resistance-like MFS transporter